MSVLLLFFVSSEEMLFIICESLKAICSIIYPKVMLHSSTDKLR